MSAINARIYLTGKDISDELFESLVDLTECRDPKTNAIYASRAYPILGLTATDGPMTIDWIRINLPVEINICWGTHSLTGLHSVLVVDVATENKKTYLNVIDHQWWKEPQWWQWSRIPFPKAELQRSRSFKFAF